MQPSRARLLLAALLSLSLIALELVWTRIFSAEFFYTFAFLILSIAVLGLGLGGLALRLFPRLNRTERLGFYILLTALLTLAGPPLVLHLGLDFALVLSKGAMFGRLALTLFLLSAAFFTGGMALSLLFRNFHEEMPRLYMADLLGAALGVFGAILLMNLVGTPATTLLIPLPLALAAFLAGGRKTRAFAALATLGCLALLPSSARLIAKPRQERLPVIHRHWDAMALLKIQEGKGYRNLNIDNSANTGVSAFDGDWAALKAGPSDFLVDPKPLMDPMKGSCRFLSIGSGGGGDVVLALKNDAAEVHAVEVNPTINRMLLPGGMLHEYSGRLYADPRVKVVTEDARTYLRRFENRFDVIYSASSNTFAALASGAFALAENYVFTTEAFEDYYRALSPRGFLMMEHQFYMPRIVSEALEGLRKSGVAQPERHLAVYTSPQARRQILLVGKQPLNQESIQGAFLALEAKDFQLMHRVYPDPEPKASPLIAHIVNQGWKQTAAEVPTDISPSTDDRPYTAQQGLMKNFKWKSLKALEAYEFRGFPLAKLLIGAVLAVILLLVLPLNLLPFLRMGPKLRAPGWLYFFAIGFGFMVIEVVLIQKYTLFVGSSAYTVATILFTLLMGSGLGSRFAPRFGDRLPFVAILLWLALDLTLFGRLTHSLTGLPAAGRMAATVLLLAPLGFFMGMPFPKGTRRAGEWVDWGFAVNGAASVLGSASILLVSFAWGFRAALIVGGLAYLAAMALLLGRQAWVTEA